MAFSHSRKQISIIFWINLHRLLFNHVRKYLSVSEGATLFLNTTENYSLFFGASPVSPLNWKKNAGKFSTLSTRSPRVRLRVIKLNFFVFSLSIFQRPSAIFETNLALLRSCIFVCVKEIFFSFSDGPKGPLSTKLGIRNRRLATKKLFKFSFLKIVIMPFVGL
jgi:hypothetical protein